MGCFRVAELWSRCCALSYVNAGLTSAVRSKQGRVLRDETAPTHSHTLSHSLTVSSHTRTSTFPLTHTHTHHAYLCGATLRPWAGFYFPNRLEEALHRTPIHPAWRGYLTTFSSPALPPVFFNSTIWSVRRSCKGEFQLVLAEVRARTDWVIRYMFAHIVAVVCIRAPWIRFKVWVYSVNADAVWINRRDSVEKRTSD